MADDAIELSADPARIQFDVVHGFLSVHAPWCKGIPAETLARALQHSVCVGAYDGSAQVDFARAVTDHATFANIVDVFVLPPHRGQGVGKVLMQALLDHAGLQGLRRITLATANAHALYAQFGFTPLGDPVRHMELHRPSVYAGTQPD